jgi:methylenetetrahydrofolate reductase (NADPH)
VRNGLSRRRSGSLSRNPAASRVVENTCFELVPLKNLEAQLAHLPSGASVSVTCSPAKGIGDTLELSGRLREAGLQPTPHIAARMVTGKVQLSTIVDRLRGDGHTNLFLVGGDAETPAGEYDGVTPLLRDLLSLDHGLSKIGVTGYPDGHVTIPADVLRRELHAKAALLREAGVGGWVSTQMCFDGPLIAKWLREERDAGLDLPVRLGIPGPIDRTKLLTMGMRVGVGQSVRYLQKNRSGLFKLLTGADYNPNELLGALNSGLEMLDVEGLHLFTLNQLDRCVSWRNEFLGLQEARAQQVSA